MTWFSADFGVFNAGLSDVGVTQLKRDGSVAVPRTAGAASYGNGLYGIDITLDPETVVIRWDTGGASPTFAHEEVASYANIVKVNDVSVKGTGTNGDEWGPV